MLSADPAGVNGVEGVLGVDERADAAAGLGLGHDVVDERRLTRGLRAEDLDHAAARDAADAEREVERERAGGDRFDLEGALSPLRVISEPAPNSLSIWALAASSAAVRAFASFSAAFCSAFVCSAIDLLLSSSSSSARRQVNLARAVHRAVRHQSNGKERVGQHRTRPRAPPGRVPGGRSTRCGRRWPLPRPSRRERARPSHAARTGASPPRQSPSSSVPGSRPRSARGSAASGASRLDRRTATGLRGRLWPTGSLEQSRDRSPDRGSIGLDRPLMWPRRRRSSAGRPAEEADGHAEATRRATRPKRRGSAELADAPHAVRARRAILVRQVESGERRRSIPPRAGSRRGRGRGAPAPPTRRSGRRGRARSTGAGRRAFARPIRAAGGGSPAGSRRPRQERRSSPPRSSFQRSRASAA